MYSETTLFQASVSVLRIEPPGIKKLKPLISWNLYPNGGDG